MSETRRDKRLALRVVVGDAFEMGPLNPADLETGSDERAKGEEVGGGGGEHVPQGFLKKNRKWFCLLRAVMTLGGIFKTLLESRLTN